jgi:ATP-binding cassette subfamily B protein
MKRYPTKQILSFYWRHVLRYPKPLAGLLITLPITILINNFLPPIILANVLSRLGRHDYQAHHIWASFGPQLVLFGVLELSGGIIVWRIVDYFVYQLEGRIERDLAQEVFAAMLNQTADFHANNFAGSLVSQNTKLLGAYIRMADATIFQISQLLFGIIFTAIILFNRAPLFVVVLLAISLFFMFTTFFVSRRVQQLSAKHAGLESKQTGFVADAITNVMVIKSFARGRFEAANFAKATDETHDNLMTIMRAHRRQLNYFNFVTGWMSILSLLFAIISVVDFNANIATVFLIFNYTAYVIGQLFQFSNNTLKAFNRALGDASDMVQILSKQPLVLDPAKPEKLRVTQGSIEFNDVTFLHDGAKRDLFNNLNLHIKHGEKIGLVGHSGSGKTTFTRLLLRFSDIQAGEILIDGQNIANIKQDDLHSSVAYVPQEPLLFHRSITDNIAYGKEGSSEREIRLAAKRANASEFIDQLPLGYDTLVGERGVKLSGGQRQRIAIARAMLKDAPILVLDEATSALDSGSEVLIQDALWKLMEGRTAIVIAHRLSTIQRMDRIIVLDKGTIVEEGSHAQLLTNQATYAKLWAHQSGGFIEE